MKSMLLVLITAAMVSAGDYASDTAIVRSILDSNGLDTVAVTLVTDSSQGRVTILNLSRLGIDTLTNAVKGLSGLKKLTISNNSLTTLPDSLVNLTLLSLLNIDSNRICALQPVLKSWVDAKAPGWSSTQQCPNPFLEDCAVVREILDSNGLYNVPVLSVIDSGPGRIVALDLSKRNLTRLPASISKLTALARLSLSYNLLTSLPESLGALKALEYLDLYSNKITELPESFCGLVRLKTLSLAFNQLCALPDSFGKLVNLTDLRIYKNQLYELPEGFSRLTGLSVLFLHYNQLSSLPSQITAIHGLANLNLANNRLCSLPPEAAAWVDMFSYYKNWLGSQSCGTTPAEEQSVSPVLYGLKQNTPNPFNPATEITFSLPARAHARLEVFDAGGGRVQVLVNGLYPAGTNTVRWLAQGRSSGLYYFRLISGTFQAVRKGILIR